jgi:hypothetical protein
MVERKNGKSEWSSRMPRLPMAASPGWMALRRSDLPKPHRSAGCAEHGHRPSPPRREILLVGTKLRFLWA